MSLPLPPSVRFCDALSELFFLRRCEMINVDTLKHARSHDGLHDFLLHLLRIQFRGTQQVAQTRLMFDLTSIFIILPWPRLSVPRLLCRPPARLLAPSQLLRRISPSLSPLSPPHCPPVRLHAWLQVRNAHSPYLLHQPLILAVTAFSMPSDWYRRYHIIARLVVLPHLLLLGLTLPSARVRLQKHLQQRRDRGIRPGPPHFGAALWAGVRMRSVLVRAHGGLALEGEPFFQTWPAESVQAVEEGQRLVEDVRADLGAVAVRESIVRRSVGANKGRGPYIPNSSAPSPDRCHCHYHCLAAGHRPPCLTSCAFECFVSPQIRRVVVLQCGAVCRVDFMHALFREHESLAAERLQAGSETAMVRKLDFFVTYTLLMVLVRQNRCYRCPI